MKTIYKLRLFVLTIIAMVAGNAFGQDTEYEFEVSGYESFGHFLAGGDSKTFRIRSSNVSWTVECDALWVHISPESGNGSAYVRIDVDPNTEDTERQTIITVNGGPAGIMEFAITQDATFLSLKSADMKTLEFFSRKAIPSLSG